MITIDQLSKIPLIAIGILVICLCIGIAIAYWQIKKQANVTNHHRNFWFWMLLGMLSILCLLLVLTQYWLNMKPMFLAI